MKNPDGSVVRIKDIITNNYISNVIANATPTQLGYGILNQIYEGATGLIDAVTIGGLNACSSGTYTFYNYLFPEIGAEVLSENGVYETVTSDWFYNYLFPVIGLEVLSESGVYETVTSDWLYNGTGKSPYWFSGGWPSIYGSGDCTTYCDVHGGTSIEDRIRGRVPVLIAVQERLPYGEECTVITLTSNVSCGLKIVQDRQDEWVEFQNCVTERSVRTVVTQSCWASGLENNLCDDGEVEVGDDCYVADYKDNE